MEIHGDPATIVFDLHSSGLGDGHLDPVAVTGHGLINGVIDHFIE
jgi:hypothetical protein